MAVVGSQIWIRTTSQKPGKRVTFISKIYKGNNLYELNERLDKYLKEESTGNNNMGKSYQAKDITELTAGSTPYVLVFFTWWPLLQTVWQAS